MITVLSSEVSILLNFSISTINTYQVPNIDWWLFNTIYYNQYTLIQCIYSAKFIVFVIWTSLISETVNVKSWNRYHSMSKIQVTSNDFRIQYMCFCRTNSIGLIVIFAIKKIKVDPYDTKSKYISHQWTLWVQSIADYYDEIHYVDDRNSDYFDVKSSYSIILSSTIPCGDLIIFFLDSLLTDTKVCFLSNIQCVNHEYHSCFDCNWSYWKLEFDTHDVEGWPIFFS